MHPPRLRPLAAAASKNWQSSFVEFVPEPVCGRAGSPYFICGFTVVPTHSVLHA